MSNKKDLTGQRYNNLIVISEVLNRPPIPRFQRSYCWLCKCLKCDDFSIGITNDVITGRHKCSCQRQIKCKQCKKVFMRRFGKSSGQINYCSQDCAALSLKKAHRTYATNYRAKLTPALKEKRRILNKDWRNANKERVRELKVKYHYADQRKKELQKLLGLSNLLNKGETNVRTTHDC